MAANNRNYAVPRRTVLPTAYIYLVPGICITKAAPTTLLACFSVGVLKVTSRLDLVAPQYGRDRRSRPVAWSLGRSLHRFHRRPVHSPVARTVVPLLVRPTRRSTVCIRWVAKKRKPCSYLQYSSLPSCRIEKQTTSTCVPVRAYVPLIPGT